MRKKLIWTTVVVSLLISLAAVNLTGCSPLPTVYMDPAVIWDLDMGPGTEFTLAVAVDYVERLWAYQVELGEELFLIPGWDASVLHLVSVENGPFLGSRGGNVVFFPGSINNAVGTLSLTIGALDPPRRFPTGGGDLLYLNFEVAGYGSTPIEFGLDSGLLDRYGNWIIRGTIDPDAFKGGFFSNVQGPELYIRTKGAHGSGVWPEWQVNLMDVPQTMYSRIASHGVAGAWVKVKFTVVSGPYGTQTYWSDEAWVDAKTGEEPELATVSATFLPPGLGKYCVSGMLYFKAEGMLDYEPYQLVIDAGGEGVAFSRDAGEHYKVVAKM
jgi:hypothetical protein